MSFKIPPFISEYFSSLPNEEEKKKAIERYKLWYSNDFTQMFLEGLEKDLEKLIVESEKDGNFLSKFQFEYTEIRNKAKRHYIRELLRKTNHEV